MKFSADEMLYAPSIDALEKVEKDNENNIYDGRIDDEDCLGSAATSQEQAVRLNLIYLQSLFSIIDKNLPPGMALVAKERFIANSPIY